MPSTNPMNYRLILTQYRQVPTIAVLYWPSTQLPSRNAQLSQQDLVFLFFNRACCNCLGSLTLEKPLNSRVCCAFSNVSHICHQCHLHFHHDHHHYHIFFSIMIIIVTIIGIMMIRERRIWAALTTRALKRMAGLTKRWFWQQLLWWDVDEQVIKLLRRCKFPWISICNKILQLVWCCALCCC